LGDDTIDVLMNILDRILDSDDMPMTILIAIADQCRHRGGFTRTGTTNENDQTTFAHDHVLQYRRQPEIVEIGNLCGDCSQNDTDPLLLHESIDTKTADSFRVD